MRPTQQFRLWMRRAPASERIGALAAAVVVIALIAWILVPGGGRTSVAASGSAAALPDGATGDAVDAGGTAAGTPAGGLAGPTSDATGAEGAGRASGDDPIAAAGSPGGGAPTSVAGGSGPSGCQSPPGTARGVSDGEVRIAVGLTNIAGPAANNVFGLPGASEQRTMFEAVIAGINREGGVACRKLVAEYHEANPADEAQMMRICLDVADGDVFAMIDTGALSSRPNVLTCFGQHEIAFFTGYVITEFARREHFPYLYAFYTREQIYRNTAFGLRDRGFFDPANGFRKLGFLVKTCQKPAIDAYRGWLAAVGMSGSKIVEYDIGCPSAFASPADLQQAVLTFQREGVTHVVTGDIQGDLAVFTNFADRQGFEPQYAFPDESVISLSYGAQRPNPDNIDGALAITLSRQGEEYTEGVAPNEGTKRCNAYYEAVGMPEVYEQHSIAGNTCGELWMLRDGLGNAPELSPLALPEGLRRTESIDLSFPQGPNDLRAEGTTTGGQFWRIARFDRACACWKVPDLRFRPSYR